MAWSEEISESRISVEGNRGTDRPKKNRTEVVKEYLSEGVKDMEKGKDASGRSRLLGVKKKKGKDGNEYILNSRFFLPTI